MQSELNIEEIVKDRSYKVSVFFTVLGFPLKAVDTNCYLLKIVIGIKPSLVASNVERLMV